MDQIVIWGLTILSVVNIVFVVLVFIRLIAIQKDNATQSEKEDFDSLREEVLRSQQETRDEVVKTQATTTNLTTHVEGTRNTVDKRFQALQQGIETRLDKIRETVTNQIQSTTETLVNSVGELGKSQEGQLDGIRKTVNDRLVAMQTTSEERSEQLHNAVTTQLQSTTDTLVNTVSEFGKSQEAQLGNVTKAISDLTESNETRIEKVRTTVDSRLQAMQESNEDKLDKMRKTVDEKLQSTLEKRLGESFNQVSKQLDEVHRGLGEMRGLATGVGDLKRVLTDVKTRGTWGEVQLGSLLQEVLTPDQYSSNVQLNENSSEQVEYAIRLPGNDEDPNACVWLPIDSKFPLADYERLRDASEAADKNETEKASATFLATVQNAAKTISEKYIVPPQTTDFAIMFLPTEGLYAEVLRPPGQVEKLLHHRIVVAGPMTLAAILSSLRMGFRTLAIQKRSSEVWEVLAAVKTEFGKFAGVMKKLRKQLDTASKTVDETGTRTRAMERKLQVVEELPLDKSNALLELPSADYLLNEDHADG